MSMTDLFGLLAAGFIIGSLVMVALVTYGEVAWRYLSEALRKPRWRIEEIQCDKCAGSDKVGFKRYETLNPVTEDVEVAYLSCDKCIGTPGKLTIAVIPDDLTIDEWLEVKDEAAEALGGEGIDKERVKRESEVREDNE